MASEIIVFPNQRIAVVKYDPPCAPIGIYTDEGEFVGRLLYNNGFDIPENVLFPKSKVESHIVKSVEGSIEEVVEQNFVVMKCFFPFNPTDFWKQPNGEY